MNPNNNAYINAKYGFNNNNSSKTSNYTTTASSSSENLKGNNPTMKNPPIFKSKFNYSDSNNILKKYMPVSNNDQGLTNVNSREGLTSDNTKESKQNVSLAGLVKHKKNDSLSINIPNYSSVPKPSPRDFLTPNTKTFTSPDLERSFDTLSISSITSRKTDSCLDVYNAHLKYLKSPKNNNISFNAGSGKMTSDQKNFKYRGPRNTAPGSIQNELDKTRASIKKEGESSAHTNNAGADAGDKNIKFNEEKIVTGNLLDDIIPAVNEFTIEKQLDPTQSNQLSSTISSSTNNSTKISPWKTFRGGLSFNKSEENLPTPLFSESTELEPSKQEGSKDHPTSLPSPGANRLILSPTGDKKQKSEVITRNDSSHEGQRTSKGRMICLDIPEATIDEEDAQGDKPAKAKEPKEGGEGNELEAKEKTDEDLIIPKIIITYENNGSNDKNMVMKPATLNQATATTTTTENSQFLTIERAYTDYTKINKQKRKPNQNRTARGNSPVRYAKEGNPPVRRASPNRIKSEENYGKSAHEMQTGRGYIKIGNSSPREMSARHSVTPKAIKKTFNINEVIVEEDFGDENSIENSENTQNKRINHNIKSFMDDPNSPTSETKEPPNELTNKNYKDDMNQKEKASSESILDQIGNQSHETGLVIGKSQEQDVVVGYNEQQSVVAGCAEEKDPVLDLHVKEKGPVRNNREEEGPVRDHREKKGPVNEKGELVVHDQEQGAVVSHGQDQGPVVDCDAGSIARRNDLQANIEKLMVIPTIQVENPIEPSGFVVENKYSENSLRISRQHLTQEKSKKSAIPSHHRVTSQGEKITESSSKIIESLPETSEHSLKATESLPKTEEDHGLTQKIPIPIYETDSIINPTEVGKMSPKALTHYQDYDYHRKQQEESNQIEGNSTEVTCDRVSKRESTPEKVNCPSSSDVGQQLETTTSQMQATKVFNASNTIFDAPKIVIDAPNIPEHGENPNIILSSKSTILETLLEVNPPFTGEVVSYLGNEFNQRQIETHQVHSLPNQHQESFNMPEQPKDLLSSCMVIDNDHRQNTDYSIMANPNNQPQASDQLNESDSNKSHQVLYSPDLPKNTHHSQAAHSCDKSDSNDYSQEGNVMTNNGDIEPKERAYSSNAITLMVSETPTTQIKSHGQEANLSSLENSTTCLQTNPALRMPNVQHVDVSHSAKSDNDNDLQMVESLSIEYSSPQVQLNEAVNTERHQSQRMEPSDPEKLSYQLQMTKTTPSTANLGDHFEEHTKDLPHILDHENHPHSRTDLSISLKREDDDPHFQSADSPKPHDYSEITDSSGTTKHRQDSNTPNHPQSLDSSDMVNSKDYPESIKCINIPNIKDPSQEADFSSTANPTGYSIDRSHDYPQESNTYLAIANPSDHPQRFDSSNKKEIDDSNIIKSNDDHPQEYEFPSTENTNSYLQGKADPQDLETHSDLLQISKTKDHSPQEDDSSDMPNINNHPQQLLYCSNTINTNNQLQDFDPSENSNSKEPLAKITKVQDYSRHHHHHDHDEANSPNGPNLDHSSQGFAIDYQVQGTKSWVVADLDHEHHPHRIEPLNITDENMNMDDHSQRLDSPQKVVEQPDLVNSEDCHQKADPSSMANPNNNSQEINSLNIANTEDDRHLHHHIDQSDEHLPANPDASHHAEVYNTLDIAIVNDHPKSLEHSPDVNNSQRLKYPQDVDQPQRLEYRQDDDRSQNIKDPQSLEQPPDVDHCQSADHLQSPEQPQDVDYSKSFEHPQGIVDHSQSSNNPQSFEHIQGADHPQSIDYSQGANHSQSLEYTQNISHPQSLEKPQIADHPGSFEHPQGADQPKRIEYHQSVYHSESLEQSKVIEHPQSLETSQSIDHPQSLENSQDIDHLQSADHCQRAVHSQSLESPQNTDHSQSREHSQNIVVHPQSLEHPQGADYSQSLEYSQSVDNPQNLEKSQDIDYPLSFEYSQNLEHPQGADHSRNLQQSQDINHLQSLEYSQSVSHLQGLDHSQSLEHFQDVGYRPQSLEKSQDTAHLQSFEYSQNIDYSQDVNHPQGFEHHQNIEYPESLDQSQGVYNLQSLESPKRVDYTQNIEYPQSINHSQKIEHLQNIEQPQDVDHHPSCHFPQNFSDDPQRADHSQDANHPHSFGYIQNVDNSQKIAPSQGTVHPQGPEYPQNIDNPQAVEHPQNVDNPRNLDCPQSIDHSQSFEHRQSLEYSQDVDHPESFEQPRGADHFRGLEYPQVVDDPEILEYPQGIDHPKSFEYPISIDDPRDVDHPQSVDHHQSLEQRQDVDHPQSLEKLRDVDHLQDADYTQILENPPQSLEQLQNVDHPQGLQYPDNIGHRQNPEHSQDTDHPQNLEQSLCADRSQSLKHPQDIVDHSQSLDQPSDTDHLQSLERTQDIANHSQRANYPKIFDHLEDVVDNPQNLDQPQDADHPQNFEHLQGVDYLQSFEYPKSIDHPRSLEYPQDVADHSQTADISQSLEYLQSVDQPQNFEQPQDVDHSQTLECPQFVVKHPQCLEQPQDVHHPQVLEFPQDIADHSQILEHPPNVDQLQSPEHPQDIVDHHEKIDHIQNLEHSQDIDHSQSLQHHQNLNHPQGFEQHQDFVDHPQSMDHAQSLHHHEIADLSKILDTEDHAQRTNFPFATNPLNRHQEFDPLRLSNSHSISQTLSILDLTDSKNQTESLNPLTTTIITPNPKDHPKKSDFSPVADSNISSMNSTHQSQWLDSSNPVSTINHPQRSIEHPDIAKDDAQRSDDSNMPNIENNHPKIAESLKITEIKDILQSGKSPKAADFTNDGLQNDVSSNMAGIDVHFKGLDTPNTNYHSPEVGSLHATHVISNPQALQTLSMANVNLQPKDHSQAIDPTSHMISPEKVEPSNPTHTSHHIQSFESTNILNLNNNPQGTSVLDMASANAHPHRINVPNATGYVLEKEKIALPNEDNHANNENKRVDSNSPRDLPQKVDCPNLTSPNQFQSAESSNIPDDNNLAQLPNALDVVYPNDKLQEVNTENASDYPQITESLNLPSANSYSQYESDRIIIANVKDHLKTDDFSTIIKVDDHLNKAYALEITNPKNHPHDPDSPNNPNPHDYKARINLFPMTNMNDPSSMAGYTDLKDHLQQSDSPTLTSYDQKVEVSNTLDQVEKPNLSNQAYVQEVESSNTAHPKPETSNLALNATNYLQPFASSDAIAENSHDQRALDPLDIAIINNDHPQKAEPLEMINANDCFEKSESSNMTHTKDHPQIADFSIRTSQDHYLHLHHSQRMDPSNVINPHDHPETLNPSCIIGNYKHDHPGRLHPPDKAHSSEVYSSAVAVDLNNQTDTLDSKNSGDHLQGALSYLDIPNIHHDSQRFIPPNIPQEFDSLDIGNPNYDSPQRPVIAAADIANACKASEEEPQAGSNLINTNNQLHLHHDHGQNLDSLENPSLENHSQNDNTSSTKNVNAPSDGIFASSSSLLVNPNKMINLTTMPDTSDYSQEANSSITINTIHYPQQDTAAIITKLNKDYSLEKFDSSNAASASPLNTINPLNMTNPLNTIDPLNMANPQQILGPSDKSSLDHLHYDHQSLDSSNTNDHPQVGENTVSSVQNPNDHSHEEKSDSSSKLHPSNNSGNYPQPTASSDIANPNGHSQRIKYAGDNHEKAKMSSVKSHLRKDNPPNIAHLNPITSTNTSDHPQAAGYEAVANPNNHLQQANSSIKSHPSDNYPQSVESLPVAKVDGQFQSAETFNMANNNDDGDHHLDHGKITSAPDLFDKANYEDHHQSADPPETSSSKDLPQNTTTSPMTPNAKDHHQQNIDFRNASNCPQTIDSENTTNSKDHSHGPDSFSSTAMVNSQHQPGGSDNTSTLNIKDHPQEIDSSTMAKTTNQYPQFTEPSNVKRQPHETDSMKAKDYPQNLNSPNIININDQLGEVTSTTSNFNNNPQKVDPSSTMSPSKHSKNIFINSQNPEFIDDENNNSKGRDSCNCTLI